MGKAAGTPCGSMLSRFLVSVLGFGWILVSFSDGLPGDGKVDAVVSFKLIITSSQLTKMGAL